MPRPASGLLGDARLVGERCEHMIRMMQGRRGHITRDLSTGRSFMPGGTGCLAENMTWAFAILDGSTFL